MKILFILLSVVIGQQFCNGAVRRLSSFSPLDLRTRKMYNFKGLPQFTDLASDEKRKVYSYEQTIIIRDSGLSDDEVHHCEVVEVYEENEATEVLEDLEFLLKLKVRRVDMETMMLLLQDCDSVDNLDDDEQEEEEEEPVEQPDSPNAIPNGIFPGTKWCGLGDISNGYHDLGKLHNVDRCCRSHDFCPIKVLSKDERYNLTNKALYTKSHCLCDGAFYDCLKKDNGWTAKFIGKLYFDAASPECITGLPETSEEDMKFVPSTKDW